MDGRIVNWSQLPPELLSTIGNRLDATIDVVRFRSVCNSWRSSNTSFPYTDLPSPLKFPCPFAPGQDAFLSENTIYCLEPLHDNTNPSSSTSIPAKACLVRVEETKPGKYPIWVRRVDGSSSPIPKVLSLLDFRMVKLGKSMGLNYLNINSCMIGVSKVIRYPDHISPSLYPQDCSIFVIYNGGKLGFAKYGDQQLTLVDDQVTDYNDIIVYRGQPCVVDKSGTVSWVDYSSLKLTQFPTTLTFGSGGSRKHLVESGGELYIVDRYFHSEERPAPYRVDEFPRAIHRRSIRRRFVRINALIRGRTIRGKTVGFKVYKAGQDWGNWVEVTSLGDEAFFLNDDLCFSVRASEFDGCKGNCIYFKAGIDGSLFSNARDGLVFNLEDGSIHKYRWPMHLCFNNHHLNRRLWILDCSIDNPPKPTVD
ncbi:hypothetical protein FNV43_RR20490 [Rhamnella rubrinervis]|uniref:F-box protein n=1 Tax=Rhamnella rubrinervis TaxID=2594499 RepID=A0A8K0E189_9ROSA|nr:hypothetical protein FNV43_RR20490 [Rhamnella rubrinervis]